MDPRLLNLREGRPDAFVLARAGLDRLGLNAPHAFTPPEAMLPAVGQGALTVATLEGHPLRTLVRGTLNHGPTEKAVLAERAMLRALEGGCRVPVGALGLIEGRAVRLRGVVVSPDGALVYRGGAEGEDPEEVGDRLARELLERGAAGGVGGVPGGKSR